MYYFSVWILLFSLACPLLTLYKIIHKYQISPSFILKISSLAITVLTYLILNVLKKKKKTTYTIITFSLHLSSYALGLVTTPARLEGSLTHTLSSTQGLVKVPGIFMIASQLLQLQNQTQPFLHFTCFLTCFLFS